MHDAVMNHRVRKDRVQRVRQARQPINQRDQDILDAPALQLAEAARPERRAFRLRDPEAEHVFRAVAVHAERQVDGLVPYHTFIANLDAQCIKGDRHVHRLQRPALPRAHFGEHFLRQHALRNRLLKLSIQVVQIGRRLHPRRQHVHLIQFRGFLMATTAKFRRRRRGRRGIPVVPRRSGQQPPKSALAALTSDA